MPALDTQRIPQEVTAKAMRMGQEVLARGIKDRIVNATKSRVGDNKCFEIVKEGVSIRVTPTFGNDKNKSVTAIQVQVYPNGDFHGNPAIDTTLNAALGLNNVDLTERTIGERFFDRIAKRCEIADEQTLEAIRLNREKVTQAIGFIVLACQKEKVPGQDKVKEVKDDDVTRINSLADKLTQQRRISFDHNIIIDGRVYNIELTLAPYDSNRKYSGRLLDPGNGYEEVAIFTLKENLTPNSYYEDEWDNNLVIKCIKELLKKEAGSNA